MQLRFLRPRTGHQDHARPVAGAQEDVVGPGGTVKEVPRTEEPLLTLDEEPTLPAQHEERLLLRLGVVEAVRLARRQDVEPYAELRERELLALERALRAGRLLSAVLRRQPLGVPYVHDEPAVAGGCEARAGVVERRLAHGASLQSRRKSRDRSP